MEETNKYLVTLDPRLGVVRKAERLGAAGELADVPAEAFSVDVARLARRPATPAGGLSLTDDPQAPDGDPPPAPHQPLAPDPSPPPAPHS